MKTLKQIELYASWGDPFDKEDVERVNKEIKELFGEGASFIIEETDDSFIIKILKEDVR